MTLVPNNEPRNQHFPSPTSSPLSSLELPRRKFLGGLVSGFVVATTPLPVAATQTTSAGLLSEFISAEEQGVISQLIKFLAVERNIQDLSDTTEFFSQAQAAVATAFSVNDGVPRFDETRAKRVTSRLLESQIERISGELNQRTEILHGLLTKREVLQRIFSTVAGRGKTVPLSGFCSVLSEEAKDLTFGGLQRVLTDESSQIEWYIRAELSKVVETTLYKTEAFFVSPDIHVFRQSSGAFSLVRDPLQGLLQQDAQELHLREKQQLTPEIYQYGSTPPLPYTLNVKNDALAESLRKLLVNRLDHIFDHVPPNAYELTAQFALLRIETLLDGPQSRAERYLSFLKEAQPYLDTLSLESHVLANWIRNPIQELAFAHLRIPISLLACCNLSTDSPPELPSYFSMHRATGISGGLFRQQRQEAMRMASVAKCIKELAAEGNLLFCDYPVKSLNEFRAIAENFSESRPFALMFLTVYDRLLQEDEARSSATDEVQP